ncbi:MAG: hypothetical protein C0423_21760 [Methylibium sp.]|nr:hypothetical protein [Methylibium sp.]
MAPRVEVSVGGGRGWQTLAGAAFATTAAALVAWLFEHLLIALQWPGSPLALAGLLLACFCLCALVAALGWRVDRQARCVGTCSASGWLKPPDCEASVCIRRWISTVPSCRDSGLLTSSAATGASLCRVTSSLCVPGMLGMGLLGAELSTHRPDTVTSGRVS